MNKPILLALILAGAAGLVLARLAPSLDGEERRPADPAPAASASASGVHRLLYARPFTLDAPYAYDWQAAPELLRAGLLVVLEVDAARAEPKDELHPVLYGGARTIERINAGAGGRIVGVLPGPVDLDLAATPFWLGAPELPERVTPGWIERERAAALAAGVQPFGEQEVQAARAAGGPALALADRDALRRFAAELVREHAPDEQDLVSGLLAPRVR